MHLLKNIFGKIVFLLAIVNLALTQAQQEHHQEHQEQVLLDNAQVWGFGFLAGFGISSIGFLAALILIVFKKCCNNDCFQMILKFMFSLSCGALLGDAVVHILSQTYQNSSTNKLLVSGIFISSIIFFVLVDRFLHSFGLGHSHWVGQKCEDQKQHDKNHDSKKCTSNIIPEVSLSEILPKQDEKKQKKAAPNNFMKNGSVQNENSIINPENKGSNITQTQKDQEKSCIQNLKGKGNAGYMNIFGSAIHNFFDGLALGVAFATAKPSQIIPVVVAIIAHEIPRELGDVAILLKSSFSQTQTVLCNGFVNFLSLIGVFIGLAIVSLDQLVKMYILVFVAGNFIYIAADIWLKILKNKGDGSKVRNLIQFFGVGVGIGAMFALTLLQTHNHEQESHAEHTQAR